MVSVARARRPGFMGSSCPFWRGRGRAGAAPGDGFAGRVRRPGRRGGPGLGPAGSSVQDRAARPTGDGGRHAHEALGAPRGTGSQADSIRSVAGVRTRSSGPEAATRLGPQLRLVPLGAVAVQMGQPEQCPDDRREPSGSSSCHDRTSSARPGRGGAPAPARRDADVQQSSRSGPRRASPVSGAQGRAIPPPPGVVFAHPTGPERGPCRPPLPPPPGPVPRPGPRRATMGP